jgi:hypothetical protein
LNLGVGFMNYVHVLGGEPTYYQGETGDGWTHEISEASSVNQTDTNIITDAWTMTKWAVSGVLFVVQMLLSIVWIEPALESMFGIPTAIGLMLQTGLYIIYTLAAIQWYTGKSFSYFE